MGPGLVGTTILPLEQSMYVEELLGTIVILAFVSVFTIMVVFWGFYKSSKEIDELKTQIDDLKRELEEMKQKLN